MQYIFVCIRKEISTGKMAQEIKVFAAEHDDFEFNLQNLLGRWKEPALKGSLVITHAYTLNK